MLVLPSRSEGLGRVVVEAPRRRGRGTVGSRVGGIPDLVTDGESGSVSSGDAAAVADALVRALSNRGAADRLGAAGRGTCGTVARDLEEYARQVRDLVERRRALTVARTKALDPSA